MARSFCSLGRGDVTKVELEGKITGQKGAYVLIDVREPHELDFGVIPSSINIPRECYRELRTSLACTMADALSTSWHLRRPPSPSSSVGGLPEDLALDNDAFEVCGNI